MTATTSRLAASSANMQQLIQLRWIAVIGQVVTIAVVEWGFGIRLPLRVMAFMLAVLVALNLVSLLRLRLRSPVTQAELFLAIAFDVMVLTVQLYLSGGATNPFVALYLLQVVLAAILLEVRWTWAMVALTSLCCLGLTLAYRPLVLPAHLEDDLFRLHLQGILVCFVLDAVLLAVFVTRITGNLRAHDAKLAHLRQQAAEEDHIVRMGLLASGAAHELGTPLATVSVILGDWKRLPAFQSSPELMQEIAEAQAALARCKSIVTGILLSAGEARGEAPSLTTLDDFLEDCIEEWRAARSTQALRYENGLTEDIRLVADPALQQVIGNVLDNALEVSPQRVHLSVRRAGDDLVLEVSDEGPGFLPEMLAELGKPYRSSKGRQGGGLGLFLVFNVLRKLGGSLAARNRPEGGATVTLTLPIASLAIDDPEPPHAG
ncbi:ATP-binding protein [Roseomonas sp. 18066]|uniref:ATP-binding protein n=1 Tax=Roseomonas sp. 18066 TaxID=2681412 RepID=UPI00190F1CE7|nr:ATP-binding protein [Roseomonas sp. 18066]